MGIVACIVLGLMAGLAAEAIHAEGSAARVRRSLLGGVLGGVAGGIVAAVAGVGSLGAAYSPGVWAAAFAGGMILLAAISVAARRRATPPRSHRA